MGLVLYARREAPSSGVDSLGPSPPGAPGPLGPETVSTARVVSTPGDAVWVLGPLTMRNLELVLLGALGAVLSPLAADATGKEVRVDPGSDWKVVGMFSGRVNYYSIIDEGGTPLIHAHYEPPNRTAIFGVRLDSPTRLPRLSWRWRVRAFPHDADEKLDGHSDNAASVYVTYAGTFRRFAIKYVWSTKYPAGTHWKPADYSSLSPMHIVVLEGPPTAQDAWREETLSPAEDFRRYFGGDADDVPPVVGLGVLSDGDGTHSVVEADYGAFRFYD
jgi:hypothetical protein